MSLTETTMGILKSLNYNPTATKKGNFNNISFTCFGFNSFPTEHKNVVRTVAGDQLSEFYYEMNTQHIILKDNPNQEELKPCQLF